ncbi:peptide deformylase [Thermodesulfobacteriota bacterium]
MPKRIKVCTYPDPVLREPARPVEDIDGEIQELVDDMAETMYAAPGIGLAANQVGTPCRILVYDITAQDVGRNLSVLINPEIIMSEGEIIHEEACLSVIDFSAELKRKAKIKVRGVDRNGNPVDIEAEGLLAVCLQHEIDHLNGTLIIDHISNLKRSLYKKKLNKMLKELEPSER